MKLWIVTAASFCWVLLLSSVALADFKIPQYETFTLDNGLQVYLMRQDEVPLVSVQLAVKAGAVLDGKSYGLASLTGDALKFGAAELSKLQLEDKLAFYGAEYSASVAPELSSLSVSFAKKDVEEIFPLFTDIALQPNFNAVEFKKHKKRLLSQLEQQRESPRNIIGDVFENFYYQGHPYGNPLQGDQASVAKLDLAAVNGFYKKYYAPNNSALIVVGDIDVRKWKARVKSSFGQWKGKAEAVAELGPITVANAARVLLINKGDASETTFRIGGPGVPVTHKDRVAIRLINTILGARFTSWLNDALRVNSGLTYGARSRFVSQSMGGSFYISTFTKNETTFEAIDLALKTYERLWEQGIDAKTLASAKSYVKGLFPPRYETSDQLADLLANNWALGLDDSVINDFETQVDALDVAEINRIAKSTFPKDNLQFVLIGKAEELREKSKEYGRVEEREIKTFSF